MRYIGFDVHERTSSLCILDAHGRVVKRHVVRGHPRKAIEWLKRVDGRFAICFEASTNYGWLHDALVPIADRVVVAHPGRLRLIFESRRKNDRIDAERLAKLLYLDAVPTVYVPSINVRDWRRFIEHRRRAVGSRTRIKNAIRALLRTYGISSPGRGSLWTARGIAWLGELTLPTEIAALQLDAQLDDLAHHDRKVHRVEQALATIATRHPQVALLMTIPGVGIRTAEAFVAYVDDPRRFKPKSIGAYIGLVPKQDSSGGMNRLGRITKEGPSTLRGLLTEAAWQGIRRCRAVRAKFEQIQKGRDDRKKRAIVATAHYLARVMLAMLISGETWREEAVTS
jgi:transposase